MKNLILIILGVIFIALIVLGFILFSNKNTWICKDGIWIRQGSPKTSQPTNPCPGTPKTPPLPIVPPESAVLSFYKSLATARESGTPSPDGAKQSSYFTENLKRKLMSSSAYACLSEQPETYKIKKSSVENQKGIVAFDVLVEEKQKTIIFELTPEGKVWKIDNVRCPKE